MKLTTAQTDRACGVLLAAAAGDALGAGYEFSAPLDGVPAMIGGGLGNFAPGEWTDDTAQAMAIALVAATGVDLRTSSALDQIAQGFADWFGGGPADVGIQTASVLRQAGSTPTGAQMAAAAQAVHERSGRSAGNGSLMRTGPVALAYLNDPVALVEAAMSISALTHYEAVAQQACAVWCLMIRHAVVHGEFPRFDDIAEWAPDPEGWREILAEAQAKPPSSFANNGWSVGALQAAWSAITNTPEPDTHRCGHLVDALGTAIRIGHDTDTVAAIAGALLGARWGMTAVPLRWRRILHGWPSMGAHDLERLAYLTVHAGQPGKYGWPVADRIPYESLYSSPSALAPHPNDPGVYLADAPTLDRLPEDTDVVVSLCLVGRVQVPEHVEHITVRLMDRQEHSENVNLDFVLEDTAELIAELRDEGKRVVVHCVAAQSRTPTIGIAYAMVRGASHDEALEAVCAVLPAADPNRGFRDALRRLGVRLQRG